VHRRRFLRCSCAGITTLAVFTSSASSAANLFAASLATRKNWAWLTLPDHRVSPDYDKLFSLLRSAGITGVLAEIYNGHQAFFPSRRLPVKLDLLGQMLPHAASAGIELHAWMWSLPCMIDEILTKHPDWYNVNALGESAATKPAYVPYYKFLDPGRPEVREWVQETVKELAAIPELAGIHLDYIRHPDAILPRGLWQKYGIVQDKVYPPYDYGYSVYEREQFKKKFGADPATRNDAALVKEWFQFRLDMVTDLVNDFLVPAAHAKSKKITAAVFPGPSLARDMVRQDWGRWRLDAFFPMLYHVFYQESPEWIRNQTREAVTTVQQPVYTGLFVPGLDDSTLARCIEKALAGGASGVSLFSASALDEKKAAMLRQVARS